MMAIYCSNCGHKLSEVDDSVKSILCNHCDHVTYSNPELVAGCLVYQDDKVLLCKRAIEPRKDLWTVPAGFMETGETVRQAAQRETLEEVGIEVTAKELFLIASLPRSSQVYILYLVEYKGTDFSLGPETNDINWFEKSEIPWDQIAFYTVKQALEKFYADKEAGEWSIHEIDFS